MIGQKVCWSHGGAKPSARQRGLRVFEAETTKRRAGAAIVALGLADNEDDVDPVEVIMHQLRQASITERALAQLLDEEHRLDQEGNAGRRPSVLVELWNEERERCAKFAEMAMRLGIAERQVRLAEASGRVIVDAVNRVVQSPELALTPEQQHAARIAMARELRGARG